MTVPVITEEVFVILKPYLPSGTYMSSAYRSPQDQLTTIAYYVRRYNSEQRLKTGTPIVLPKNLSVNFPETWLPALLKLRESKVAINAPIPTEGIRDSPHSKLRAVLDVAHPKKTLKKLDEIKQACLMVQSRHIVGFRQILVESKPWQMAVHLDVAWVSTRALHDLWSSQGYANV